MKSITLASIVFTLSFCLHLVEGRRRQNLPYKGSPSAGAETNPVEVEDTENNNGERCTDGWTDGSGNAYESPDGKGNGPGRWAKRKGNGPGRWAKRKGNGPDRWAKRKGNGPGRWAKRWW